MELPSYLSGGEIARLIPVASAGNRELRATSILLSTLSMVPSFAAMMLGTVGQRMGVRAKLDCYTEVVLKEDHSKPKCRPDGLIVLDGGRGRTWTCLVEAKIGRATVEGGQVERYLTLARRNGIDAVLTLSNEFASLPTHSPVLVPRKALRGVDLFHWSWMSVLTQALILLQEDGFEHPAQKLVLAEMTRYFSHPSIGVSTFDRMNAEWKGVVSRVQAGASLNRSEKAVENSVSAWHQEMRGLALLLGRKLYRPVRIRMPRAHLSDPAQRMRDDAEKLATEHRLDGVFDIPDAAAPLVVTADLLRRSVQASMTLAAPGDRKRASSRINWLLRQLSKAPSDELHLKANWPGRTPATQADLASVLQDASVLEAENKTLTPTSFEVILVRDLAGRFSGPKVFIEQLEEVVPLFYKNVGQRLRAYVAAPPRIVQKKTDADEDADEGQEGEMTPIATEAESIALAAAGVTGPKKGPAREASERGSEDKRDKPIKTKRL